MGGEEREVAVKTLADGSTEEKRIQFLQEAAIMSQFKHPNVITLHGVSMEKESVNEICTTIIYMRGCYGSKESNISCLWWDFSMWHSVF